MAGRLAKGWHAAHATLYLFLPTKEVERFLTRALATPSEIAGVDNPTLFGAYLQQVREGRTLAI
jgi:hypothetical protein